MDSTPCSFLHQEQFLPWIPAEHPPDGSVPGLHCKSWLFFWWNHEKMNSEWPNGTPQFPFLHHLHQSVCCSAVRQFSFSGVSFQLNTEEMHIYYFLSLVHIRNFNIDNPTDAQSSCWLYSGIFTWSSLFLKIKCKIIYKTKSLMAKKYME